jgi:hypothetical protein
MTEATSILEFKPIERIRKNHALEHATLQVLSAHGLSSALAGYSNESGFFVFGDVSTAMLQSAANEALLRLKAGEYQLAVHPNCGTNLAATGVIAGTLAWLGMLGLGSGFKKKLDRWPTIITLVMLGVYIAQPVGPKLQKFVTTKADVGEMEIAEITLYQGKRVPMHRVRTRG